MRVENKYYSEYKYDKKILNINQKCKIKKKFIR